MANKETAAYTGVRSQALSLDRAVHPDDIYGGMGDPGNNLNPYLSNAILTASPEQLQLMLYDGAIRFASQARDAIQAGDIERSYNLLTRAQRIVSEMEGGLRHELAPDICGRMAALYGFVFGKLVNANVHKDLDALNDALRILRMQRETWAILLEKVQKARADAEHTPVLSTAAAPDPQHTPLSVEG